MLPRYHLSSADSRRDSAGPDQRPPGPQGPPGEGPKKVRALPRSLAGLNAPKHAGDWPELPGEPNAARPRGLPAADPHSLPPASRYFPVHSMA